MKLLYTINSPYARKVRIVAAYKHIELDYKLVDLSDPNNEVKEHNPLGKVPVLVLDNGDSIFDSTVIVEYLDKKSPVANLIPAEHEQKVQVKCLESLADGICDAAVAVMLESRRDASKQDEAFLAKQYDKVLRGLQVLEKNLGDKTWCVDGKYSLADIAVGCMLGYVALRFEGKIDLQKDYVNLARLNEALMQRPNFIDTQPQPKP